MHPLRARLLQATEVEALEQPELLEEDRRLAPRAGLEDLVAVVVDGERLLPGRRPVAQVVLAEQTGVALAGAVEPLAFLEADDLLRDEAAVPAHLRRVELRVPVSRGRFGLHEDAPEGLGQGSVPVQGARLRSGEVDVDRGRPVVAEELLDLADRVADRRECRVAILGVADREVEHVPERQGPVLAQQLDPAAESPWDDRGQRAGAGDQLEPELVAVPLDRRRPRRGALRAEDERPVTLHRPDEGREVAAGAVEVRLDDLQRESGRDGGVERVPALLEHGHPGCRREPVRRGHHPERPAQLGSRREAHRPTIVCRAMHARLHSLRLDPKLVAIGLGGGLLSGLLGVGGGIVMVPLLVLWAAYSQRDAHAISLGAIIPISIAGIATYGVAGEVRYGTAIALAAGSIVGARIGAGWLARIDERLLKVVFGTFLVAVAVLLGVH